MRHLAALILGLSLSWLAGPAAAEMYKWVDENGVTHYGDKIPPQYAKQQREVINKEGQTVKVLEHEKTAEERAEDARREELKRQDEEQTRRDRILLDMYPSEENIVQARDEQLDNLDGGIRIAEISIQGTEKDLKTRQERAAQLTKEGKPVPDAIQKQIQDLETRLATDKKALALRQQERQALASRFDRDLLRWRQLKGVSAPTAGANLPANQGADTGVGK